MSFDSVQSFLDFADVHHLDVTSTAPLSFADIVLGDEDEQA